MTFTKRKRGGCNPAEDLKGPRSRRLFPGTRFPKEGLHENGKKLNVDCKNWQNLKSRLLGSATDNGVLNKAKYDLMKEYAIKRLESPDTAYWGYDNVKYDVIKSITELRLNDKTFGLPINGGKKRRGRKSKRRSKKMERGKKF